MYICVFASVCIQQDVALWYLILPSLKNNGNDLKIYIPQQIYGKGGVFIKPLKFQELFF